VAVRALGLLALLAAALSPQPVFMSMVVMVLISAGWGARILGFFKVNTENLTLFVFLDRQIRLESNCKDTVGGRLECQQWCTHWFAVLRIRVGSTVRNLLILSAQQQSVDDFQRLNMWLRQDFCSRAKEDQVLDV